MSSPKPPNPRVYDAMKATLGFGLRLVGLTLVHGERIPREGAAIIAANHITNFDPFAVGQATPRRVHFMAKKELFRTPVGRWFYTSGNAFPVDRSKADLGAIKTALRLLQRGEILVMFPQGTRGGTEAREGVAFLALRARCPVVPAGISRRGLGYRIVYGEPIPPTGTSEELTTAVMAEIARLSAPDAQVA